MSDNIDVDMLDKELSGLLAEKNTITEDEFIVFLPLYNKELGAKLTPEQKKKLVTTFHTRFSIFETITIVNSAGDVVVKLPAVVNKVSTINMPGTDTAHGTPLDAFVNVSTLNIGHPAQIAQNISRVGNVVMEMAKHATAAKKDEYASDRAERESLLSNFKQGVDTPSPTTTQDDQVDEDDFDWG